jgi:small-conductance mechanosensitive channel
METPKSTSILNEIMEKLSLIVKEDELAQGIQEDVVAEEVELSEEEVAVEEPAEEQEANEEAAPESTEEEVQLEEQPEEEATEEVELMEGYVKEERFEQEISELKSMVNAMKKMIDEDMGYMKKEKEALSAQVEELSAEPAAEPIAHTPEVEEQRNVIRYAENRKANTLDRVFDKISNLK